MIFLFTLLYIVVGFLWLVAVGNKFEFWSPIQPLVMITLWPFSMLGYYLNKLIR